MDYFEKAKGNDEYKGLRSGSKDPSKCFHGIELDIEQESVAVAGAAATCKCCFNLTVNDFIPESGGVTYDFCPDCRDGDKNKLKPWGNTKLAGAEN